MRGAHQRSVVVQPYGRNSVGVVSVSAYGWKNEKRLVKKKPPFAVSWRTILEHIWANYTILRETYQGCKEKSPRILLDSGRGMLEDHGGYKVAE